MLHPQKTRSRGIELNVNLRRAEDETGNVPIPKRSPDTRRVSILSDILFPCICPHHQEREEDHLRGSYVST